jgi:hypothetical protein
VAEGKGFNKKDASQIAAQLAVDKLGITWFPLFLWSDRSSPVILSHAIWSTGQW